MEKLIANTGNMPGAAGTMSCFKEDLKFIEESWSARILEISKVRLYHRYDRLESVISHLTRLNQMRENICAARGGSTTSKTEAEEGGRR